MAPALIMLDYHPLFWVVLITTILISGWASVRVQTAFSRWNRVRSRTGLTGAEAARIILEQNGIFDVRIEPVSGLLTDHYDPRTKTLRLSPSNYQGSTVAAVGIAAHEVGHALQHAQGYAPLALRSFIAVPAALGSQFAYLLIFLGALFHSVNLIGLGIVFFGLTVFFQFVTLPVEVNASVRAIRCVDAYGLAASPEEREGMVAVLRAAAWTYVAAAVTSLLWLIYYLVRYGGVLGSGRR